MAIMLPDPEHIINAKQAAIEAGFDAEIANNVLNIAAQIYHDQQSSQHSKMTLESLEALGTLYKYRDAAIERNWEILEKQELYFPNPSSFNDPFDSSITIRYDLLPIEVLREMAEAQVRRRWPYDGLFLRQRKMEEYISLILNPETHDKAVGKFLTRFTSKTRVFCICPDRGNILLWSHYANNHTGFAIGFEPMKLFNVWQASNGFLMGHVAYRDTYPILLPPEIEGHDLSRAAKEDIVTSVMNIKSNIWAYEKEVRLTMFDGPEKFHFNSDLIKDIVIGCKATRETQDRVLAAANAKYPHASVYRAKLSRDAFALDFIQIK